MNNRLFIIHTTPLTIEPLKALVAEMIPDLEVYNIVDDSVLPELIASNGDVSLVADRMVQYAVLAEKAGAELILSACSSVGGLVNQMQKRVNIPVFRIDQAMAEKAVSLGTQIGVVATLSTTLRPTVELVNEEARKRGKEIFIRERCLSEAFQALKAGDTDRHDDILAEALVEIGRKNDVVVLAQASMARVLASLGDVDKEKFLTSPRLAIKSIKNWINNEV